MGGPGSRPSACWSGYYCPFPLAGLPGFLCRIKHRRTACPRHNFNRDTWGGPSALIQSVLPCVLISLRREEKETQFLSFRAYHMNAGQILWHLSCAHAIPDPQSPVRFSESLPRQAEPSSQWGLICKVVPAVSKVSVANMQLGRPRHSSGSHPLNHDSA